MPNSHQTDGTGSKESVDTKLKQEQEMLTSGSP